MRELRDTPGRELGVTGSIGVAQQHVVADLIDEYRPFVYPVTVASGARLFPDGSPSLGLRLIDCRAFESGVAVMRYERQR